MKNSLLLVTTLISSTIVTSTEAKVLKEIRKPNILWIITDDQRADALECWNKAVSGNTESELGYVYSPNINKLASEGVLFTNSYCNSPVSAPSRASMHTGRYPHHSGIYAFELTHNENNNANPILPEIMQKAGYKTTLFGKLGVRIMKYTKPLKFNTSGWFYNECITMENDLERKGITDMCHKAIFTKDEPKGNKIYWYYPNGEVISYYTKREKAALKPEDIQAEQKVIKRQNLLMIPSKDGHGEIIGGVSTMPTEKTLDGRIAQEFCTYLSHPNENYALLCNRQVEGPKNHQPQFINLGFHFPHTAIIPSKEFRDQFQDKKYKIPIFDTEEYNKMPSQLKIWQNKHNITSLTNKQKEQFIRDYYAYCAMGDKLIGKAIDKFKSYCNERNESYMIVLVCGDHGWHLGEQGVTYKASNYIKSNQTAIIVVSSDKKKFPEGIIVNDFVEFVDLYPTFLSAAGIDVKNEKFKFLDGRDLAITASQHVKPRDYVLGETNVLCGPRAYLRGHDFAFSMRSRKLNNVPSFKHLPNKDVKWILECAPQEAEMALFDLRVDPKETNNVAYCDEYKDLAQWFRNKLGNIVLGDDRMECIWSEKNNYNISSFAEGCDDKNLKIPNSIIPKNK